MTDNSNARNVRVDVFAAQMRALSRDEREALSEQLDRQNVAELERAAIARRIKQARKEAGLSQPEMADALGVISRTYQNYESASQPRIPWGSMNDIAKITGKSTEWLIHGDRPTPDLMGLAEHDQVDGGFQEFRGYVAELNEKLDDLSIMLAVIAKHLGVSFEEETPAEVAAAMERVDRLLAEGPPRTAARQRPA